MRHSKIQRRGIVLLVVLSLLTLFAILGVTFLLVAGQYKTAAASAARVDRYTTPPEKQLHSVMLQLIRDTKTRSHLQSHGLLNDHYGNDGVRGVVYNPAGVAGTPSVDSSVGGEFVILYAIPDTTQPFSRNFSDQPDYYAGRVITFLTGTATNLSARIVDYRASKGAVDGVWGTPADDNSDGDLNDHGERFASGSDDYAIIRCELLQGRGTGTVVPGLGSRFIINGQPFNGTGHGYATASSNIDQMTFFPGLDGAWGIAGTDDDGINGTDDIGEAGAGDDLSFMTALMPNQMMHQRGHAAFTNNGTIGGADEDYDTFDYQNMFLAMVPPDISNLPEIIPSFHRPALVNYWFNWARSNLSDISGASSLSAQWNMFTNPSSISNATQAEQVRSILRGMSLRPSVTEHPEFAVNNPDFHLLGNQSANLLGAGTPVGSWDVDNDGDGIPDSIWIDAGLPVQTAPDGRRYRPLVAILCQDLDGRLNLNAHDKDPTISPLVASGGRFNLNSVNGPYAGTFNGMSNNNLLLPRSLGTGGADVRLAPLFASATDYTNIVQARYRAGTSVAPGVASTDDALSSLKFHHMPSNYATQISSYLSPPDLNGVLAMGLDHYGQPLPRWLAGAGADVDDPYEMFMGNHFGEVRSSSDAPYNVFELERLLRFNDRDRLRIPSRLLSLASSSFSLAGNRQRTTVLSSYVPVPGSALYPGFRSQAADPSVLETGPAYSILDLYYRALYTSFQAANGSWTREQSEDAARAAVAQLMPFEMMHGQRFDLNRAFGNGVDDNANFVVDESTETTQKAWDTSKPVPTAFQNANFDGINDDPIFDNGSTTPPRLAANPRFAYARHLYCLALLVMTDQSYMFPSHNAGGTPSVLATRQRIAQWAVNVVDFRDSDAIMTPFEYDTNPFNGWSVDGNPNTDEGAERGLVWGCEAPDLLITETFAMHDRGIKDTKWDNGLGGEGDAPMMDRSDMPTRDISPDQYRIPKGSLFVELYCPRGNELQRQLELYNTTGNLDLARMSPSRTIAGNTVTQPVWRLAISNAPSTTSTSQVTGAQADTETYGPTAIDRIVWFTNQDPDLANSPDADRTFYNQTTVTTINPNGYMMVGPRATTPIGALRDSDPTMHSDSSHALNFNLGAGTFYVNSPTGADITSGVSNIRTPVSGMICAAKQPADWTAAQPMGAAARTIGMNVSEPLPRSGSYYKMPNPEDDMRDPPDSYMRDESLPVVIDPDPAINNSIPDVPFAHFPGVPTNTGTELEFTSCFLQRLADPTQPWNPPSTNANHDPTLALNPYITVDFAPVDLSVFAGDENTDRTVTDGTDEEWLDPDDENPYGRVVPPDPLATNSPDALPTHFKSRQRNGGRRNIWSPSTLEPNGTTSNPDPNAYVPYQLNPWNSAAPGTQGMTFGYLNSAFGDPVAPQSYLGAPASPFPWMAWNNRPFTSPYELLMVPASAPGRLLLEYSSHGVPTNFFSTSQVQDDPYASGSFGETRTPCAHLLNFFQTSASGSGGSATNFYRLFDFVEVPSPYIGTEKWYNPVNFAYNTAASPQANRNSGAASFRPPFNKLSRFRDPGRVNVNTIIPERQWTSGVDGFWGRAGIDDDGNGTVDDISERGWPDSDDVRENRVWEGIAKNFPELDPGRHDGPRIHPGEDGVWGSATGGPMSNGDDNNNMVIDDITEAGWPGTDDFTRVFAERLMLSRQGYGRTSNEFMSFDSSLPSRFANPFRSAASADLMPSLTDSNGISLRKRGVDATFLREDFAPHFDPGADGVWGTATGGAMMNGDDNNDGIPNDIREAGFAGSDDIPRTEPLFVPDASGSGSGRLLANSRGVQRNPYFRYQALQHVGNTLSTTSNAFAVWLTIGYFEVSSAGTVDFAHPDGLMLGQEVGLDTGDVKRHRAFYIIDRSIPVGFEPGENHNVEKTILLRRYIE